MKEAEIPFSEIRRLSALDKLQILDTLPEEDFDAITQLASEICGVPISLVSLIDKDRQWFKSRVGIDIEESARNISFCGHAINTQDEFFLINDSSKDERFADNPLATMENGVVFYAGFPLTDKEGNTFGTLCVIDHKPRELSEFQIGVLKKLSKQIVKLLELRLANIQLNEATLLLNIENKKLSSVINSNYFGVAVWDVKNNRLNFSNNYFENLFGFENLQQVFELKDFLTYLKADNIDKILDKLYIAKSEVFLKDILVNFTISIELKTYVDIHFQSILDAEKNIDEVWIYVVDVSQKMYVQQNSEINGKILHDLILERTKELENAGFQLKERNEELEQFAYITSHDLQEPLRKVQTFLSMLKSYNPYKDERTLELFEKIDVSTIRMRSQINDILSYSRLHGIGLEHTNVNLNHTIGDVIIDLELQIEEKNARIEMDALPTIIGLPVQLKQLFYNLFSNSLKFNEQTPKIKLEYKLVKYEDLKFINTDMQSGDFHEISLMDNGIGFDMKYSEQIFTIFQRLHDENKYTGTGIGLALVKKIIDNHDAHIVVNSIKEVGTEFKIYFPVV